MLQQSVSGENHPAWTLGHLFLGDCMILSVLRVPNAPQMPKGWLEIYAPGNPSLWFRADTITGISTGTGISTWVNLAGSGGNNAAQSTVGERPVLQTTGGRQVLEFTSASSQFLRCSTSVFSSKDTRAMWAVYRVVSTAVNQVNGICGASSGDNANTWFMMQSRTNAASSGNPYFAGYANDLGGADYTTAWILGGITLSSASSAVTLRKNGSLINSTIKATLNTVDTDFLIGRGLAAGIPEFLGGKIGEILVYRVIPTTAQIEDIERELCARWGITFTTAATT